MRSHGHRRRLGQYFTPPQAASFVLRAAAAALGRRPERFLDPSCGNGVFLRAALTARVVRPGRAFGVDIDPSAVVAAQRLVSSAHIAVGDGLVDPMPDCVERARRGGFQLVAGNPPFGGGGGNGRLEVRFAERFAELVAPGGAGGVILPSGVFANAASQRLRDRLLAQIDPVAIVELPPHLFRREGATARTFALVFRKRAADGASCLVVPYAQPATDSAHFAAVLASLRAGESRVGRLVPNKELRGRRWDPAYWVDRARGLVSRAKVPLERLGRFIEFITYGPIVTGERRGRDAPGDVRVIGLREIRPTGLDLRSARRVKRGGVHDPQRCRLRRGDVVLARSGVGCLMKGRVAVFGGRVPATVGCFVDLLRLRGVAPGYAALCLRSALVREQVEALANGVGTPNLSFAEIRALLIPRLGRAAETQLARREAAARALHFRSIREGREPVAAARALETAAELIDNTVAGGAWH